jgi:hypothetical protein
LNFMNLEKIKSMEIKECDQEYWDNFVDLSPQGTVLNKSFYLKIHGLPVKYLICWKGEEAIAGFGFVCSASGIAPMPYGGFVGILLKDFSGSSNYRVHDTVFEAIETFAQYLFDNYREVNLLNHWGIKDIRPFDWFNYSDRSKGYYQTKVYYTSVLDISNPQDTSGYARKRIRDLSKSEKCITKETDDIQLLDRLHEMNFIRQGIERPHADILHKVCETLINHKAGKLLATYVDDEPAVVSLFYYEKNKAHHMLVGTDLKFRDLGVGTKNFCDSCSFLHSIGIKELDLGGVNSPSRASYKLSYGGELVNYYQIKKMLPNI